MGFFKIYAKFRVEFRAIYPRKYYQRRKKDRLIVDSSVFLTTECYIQEQHVCIIYNYSGKYAKNNDLNLSHFKINKKIQ